MFLNNAAIQLRLPLSRVNALSLKTIDTINADALMFCGPNSSHTHTRRIQHSEE